TWGRPASRSRPADAVRFHAVGEREPGARRLVELDRIGLGETPRACTRSALEPPDGGGRTPPGASAGRGPSTRRRAPRIQGMTGKKDDVARSRKEWEARKTADRSRRRRNHHRVRVQYRAGEWPCRFTTGLAFAPTDFTIFIKRGPPTWLRH